MRDEKKTKPQLIAELSEMRQRVAALEIVEVAHEQTEELLSESKSKYQLLVDNLTNPLTVYDSAGLIIYANFAGAGNIGTKPEQAAGKYLHDLFPQNIADIWVERARKIFESGEGMEADDEVPLPSGNRWYHSTIQLVKGPNGKAVAVQTISYDITERKLAEERAEHLNLILRSIRDVNQLIVTEKDPDKLIQKACNKLTQTRGYQTAWIALTDESGTLLSSTHSGFDSDAIDLKKQPKRQKLPKCAQTALKQSAVLTIEDRSKMCQRCRFREKARDLGALCVRLEHDQHIYGVMCVSLPTNMTSDAEEQSVFAELASDIALAIHSIDSEKERQEAKGKLAESEEKFRMISEQSLMGIIITQNGHLKYVNQAMANIVGHSVEEMLSWTEVEFTKNVHPDDFELVAEQGRKKEQGIENGIITNYVFRIITVTGEAKWVDLYSRTITYAGKPADLIILVDITGRKQAEEELKKTEAFNFALFQYNAVPTIIVDLEGRVVKSNLAQRYSGHRLPDIGAKMYEDYAGNHEIDMRTGLMECIRSGKPKEFPEQKYHDRHLSITISPFSQGAMIMANDVTERKQAEESLRESEEKLSSTFASMDDLVFVLDKDGIFAEYHQPPDRPDLYISPVVFLGKSYSEMMPPHITQLFDDAISQMVSSGTVQQIEYSLEMPEGSICYNAKLTPRKDVSGEYAGTTAVIRDITERKQAEEALRETEEKWRSLTDNTNDIIQILDIEGNILYMNKVYPPHTLEDVIGMPVFEFMDEQSRQTARYSISRLLEEKTSQNFEIVILLPGHGNAHFDVKYVPMFANGEVDKIIAFVSDIQERKQAEEALRESEERYRFLTENMADIVWILDQDFETTYVSPSIEKVLGFTPEERKLQTLREMITPDSLERITALFFEELQRDKEPNTDLERSVTMEVEYYHAQGHTIWLENSMKALRDETGTIVGMYGSSRDITERKQAERVLQENEERFRSLIENASDGIAIVNSDGSVKYESPSNQHILGYSAEEMPDINMFHTVHSEDHPKLAENFVSLLKEHGTILTDNYRIWHQDRTWHTIETISKNLIGDPKIGGIIVNFRDVTDRKRAEELTLIQRDLAQTLNSMNSLEEAAEVCVETAFDTTGFDCGGVYVMDQDAGRLDLVYTKGLTSGFVENVSQYDGESPNTQLIKSGKPIYTLYSELGILLDNTRNQEGLHAIAIIPVIHEGNPIGCLNIASHILDEISPYSKSVLESIAAQLGGTIARFQAVDALQESEDKYRNVVERANDVIIIIQDGVIKYANPLASVMTGYTLEEALGESLMKFVHPDELDKAIDRYTRRMAGEDVPGIYETALIHKDGTRVDVELSGGIITYHGKLADLIIIRDITERKRSDRELRESEEKLRTIFENANDAIVYVDEQGAIIDTNSKLEGIFGYTREEILGKHFAEFTWADPANMGKIVDLFAAAFETEGPSLIELEIRHKDGHIVFAEASTTTIDDETGTRRGALTILRDITERKKAEEEVARAEALEELDILRTALLASVSHELRTPLTSIKGLASTLVQPDVQWDKETQEDFLNSIVRESDRLNHIVGDLLDMSRLESGTMTMRKTECTLSSIVREIRNQLNVLVANNGFEIVIPSDLPVIYVDEIRIGEVIINLVSNAVSYSEDDTEITLQAQHHDNEILVSVTDQGIGIADEHLDKVFDRFYRLEGGAVRRRGGSGLGLAICRGIVEAHSGRIWAERNDDEGSKFNFCLPTVDILEVNSEQNVSTQMNDQEQDVPFPDVPSSTSIGSIRE